MVQRARTTAVPAAACVVVAVAVVVAIVTGSTGDGDGGGPAGPGDRTASPSHRPDDAGSGATKDEPPGSAASYWTDERIRSVSPAPMPEP
jgi:hypothetical protein